MEEEGAHATQAAQPGARAEKQTPPEPIVITMQDLLDLPRQVLPPDTYKHLQNATRETALACYSLWRHLNKSMSSSSTRKVRKHIDVE
jgi:predicted glycosyl hydrolase (DUF1957 family)